MGPSGCRHTWLEPCRLLWLPQAPSCRSPKVRPPLSTRHSPLLARSIPSPPLLHHITIHNSRTSDSLFSTLATAVSPSSAPTPSRVPPLRDNAPPPSPPSRRAPPPRHTTPPPPTPRAQAPPPRARDSSPPFYPTRSLPPIVQPDSNSPPASPPP